MASKDADRIGKLQDIVPTLTNDNYAIWSRKFMLGLKAIGISNAIDGTLDISAALDGKIHAVLLLSVDESIYPVVENSTSTQEAWNILRLVLEIIQLLVL